MSSTEIPSTRGPDPAAKPNLLKALINSPFAGIAPWIVMSLLSGPGRFEFSVVIALAISLSVFAIGRRYSASFKLMEIFDLVFFVGFAIIGILASPATISWLETWAGEITNVALLFFVLLTIVVKKPFTLQYAREETDPAYWDNPLFLRANYIITWVWAAAFAFQTLVGIYADGIQGDPNSFWTGWILPIAVTVFAIAFTSFYPDYAPAKARGEKVSLLGLVDWVPVFVIITGVTGLIFDSVSTILGIALIVIGVIAEQLLIQTQKKLDGRAGSGVA